MVFVFNGSLPVGLAQHDLPMKPFHGPAIFAKRVSQVVQQLGMRRRLATRTKIVRRSNQTEAKVILPDPIHKHTGSQRIAIGDDRTS